MLLSNPIWLREMGVSLKGGEKRPVSLWVTKGAQWMGKSRMVPSLSPDDIDEPDLDDGYLADQ